MCIGSAARCTGRAGSYLVVSLFPGVVSTNLDCKSDAMRFQRPAAQCAVLTQPQRLQGSAEKAVSVHILPFRVGVDRSLPSNTVM